MERNYDEVIADMLIQLDQLEMRRIEQDIRMEKIDKRLELTIKRMVKAESRLEVMEKKIERFDETLKQWAIDQREFRLLQTKTNHYLLDFVKRYPSK